MARCSHHGTSGQLASGGAIASVIRAGSFLWDICLSPFRNKKRCGGGANELSGHWQMGWLKKPMRCGAECSMLGWLMQHAAVAVAPRCADGVNNFDIHFHEIYLPLPSILVFVPTNSVSRFHQFRYSFPSIQIPVSTNLVVPFHEFGFSLSPIRSFLSTNSNSRFHEFNSSLPRTSIFASTDSDIPPHECGKTKKTSFCGDVFLYRFSFKWRCLADSNRRRRFCRPLTKPLIQGTIP